jgi:RNA polymerase sigma factor (sigma-70 family)
MNDAEHNPEPSLSPHRFVTTPWTDVLLARDQEKPEARTALERLCQTYRYPIYAHLRQQVASPHDAEDLTQEFFSLLIEKNYLGAVDRKRGKFRSFLLVAVNRFLSNARRRNRAAKRGGRHQIISLDEQDAEGRYLAEPATELSPEKIFERRWAKTVLDQALRLLRDEYATAGKATLFEAFQPFLLEETGAGGYAAVAEQLQMKEGTVSVAVHRLRHRYRELIRSEIQLTVANPADVDAEMRHLLEVLST